jgi:hypothetical protein
MLKIALNLALLALGALAGYLYYRHVGCSSGTCSITSNAWSSVIFGALLLWLALSPVIDRYTHQPNSPKSEQGR